MVTGGVRVMNECRVDILVVAAGSLLEADHLDAFLVLHGGLQTTKTKVV